ncbi:o-succinylbenzoate synthase [Actinorhabdospora filicis]|uniref:o-succinylbenzoate synthase n=1 Tax=Actinorhabdospora filicis TaxID=1785913 RepID=A0A9W6WA22_9ACTN|nr:o-succinylbenzoate synthase [Actinorhabdospora filicis]GLZ78593.1 o-succinylbenzoate synthase [Actinorhabdospora filicis]
MRVDRIEAFRVSLPLVHEFQTSSHRKSHLEHVLVKVTDAGGAAGWGEIASPSGPFYSPETVETCWLMLRGFLAPAVLGRDWDHPSQVPGLWAKVRGHEFTKAGLDMAAWTLWTGASGTPLAAALGGTRAKVTAGVSLGIEPTVDDLLAQVAAHDAAGYPRIKLKIQPGWDVEPVKAVRAAFPHLQVHVDANGVYTEAQAEVFTELDSTGLVMIEQPYAPRALAAHARLQKLLETPICLDESVVTVDDLDTALALDAGRVLNIKVSRMGGLTAAVAAHDRAREAGIPVWCGGMHEFGVGRAANVALSALPGFTLPSDVSGSDKYYAREVIAPPVVATQGRVTVPVTAGLGHDVDEEFVRAQAGATLDLRG